MLLWGICIVLMIFVMVTLVDYVVLLHLRMEFDRICQGYFWLCDQNVGLSKEEVASLKKSLDESGFKEIQVVSPEPGRVSRGELVVFTVEAHRSYSLKRSLFTVGERLIEFNYHQEVISRQVVN